MSYSKEYNNVCTATPRSFAVFPENMHFKSNFTPTLSGSYYTSRFQASFKTCLLIYTTNLPHAFLVLLHLMNVGGLVYMTDAVSFCLKTVGGAHLFQVFMKTIS